MTWTFASASSSTRAKERPTSSSAGCSRPTPTMPTAWSATSGTPRAAPGRAWKAIPTLSPPTPSPSWAVPIAEADPPWRRKRRSRAGAKRRRGAGGDSLPYGRKSAATRTMISVMLAARGVSQRGGASRRGSVALARDQVIGRGLIRPSRSPVRRGRRSRAGAERRVVGHVDDEALVGEVLVVGGHELLVVVGEVEVEGVARVGVHDLQLGSRHRELAEGEDSALVVHVVGRSLIRRRERSLGRLAGRAEDQNHPSLLQPHARHSPLDLRRRKHTVRGQQEVV